MATTTSASRSFDEAALRLVMMATAGTTGDEFFRCLVQSLAEALQVRYSFVTECDGSPPERVATLAFWDGNRHLDRLEWNLEGTPCEDVVGGASCAWGRDIQRLFPDDSDLVDLEAESYAAAPMYAGSGEVIGHLAVLDVEPFEDRKIELALLEVFAARAAAELERHRVQGDLFRSQARLRQVIDLVPHFIFAKDAKGRFLLANRAVADAYGTEPRDLIGRSDFDFNANAGEVEGFLADDRQVIESGVPKVLYEQITDAAGNRRSLQTTKIPFEQTAGATPSVLGVSVDVTEREQLQAQLLHVQKLESLGVLAGGIAHDFNNLLAGILGNASLASAELPADSPTQAYLKEIERAADRSAELANQMLAYAGRGHLQFRPVQLGRLVREMLELLRSSLSKKTRLELDLASDLPAVGADPTQLRQVVMNLVTNASESMEAKGGGMVKVGTRFEDVPAGHFADAYVDDDLPAGAYLVLEVTDEGRGMEADVLQRLFDPFFSTKEGGRGLGLSAVLGVVRGHRGAVKIDSRPGAGSSFRIYLPVLDGDRRALRASQPADGTWQGGGTALVADDERLVRKLAESMLERLGFAVLTATNGTEALEVFDRHADRIDVALLDVSMPGLDGLEVLANLRRRRADLPVILSSGYSDVLDEEAIDHEYVEFLSKPYRLRQLREVLQALMASD